MSIEALNWARKTFVGDAMAKSLLRAIADYADEQGKGWPSLSRLADDCDMSIDSVRRRMKSLEDIGLIVIFPCWMDEHGKRNHERRGRQTSSDIVLLLDVVRRRAAADDAASDGADEAETPLANSKGGVAIGEGGQQRGAGLQSASAPPQSARGGVAVVLPPNEPPSNQESPPSPPPGGRVVVDDGSDPVHFTEFRRDYPGSSVWDCWPKARQLFAALSALEAEHARAALPLYDAEIKRTRTKPMRPDRWLRNRVFENFDASKLPPPPSPAVFIAAESEAFKAMCTVARICDARLPVCSSVPGHGEGLMRRGELPPDYLALHRFADIAVEQWFVAEGGTTEFIAWAKRLQEWTSHHVEPQIVMLEGTTEIEMPDGRTFTAQRRTRGLRVPCRWPPRKNGTLSAMGEETMMTEDDAAVLAQEGMR